jgi:hypothetical protein
MALPSSTLRTHAYLHGWAWLDRYGSVMHEARPFGALFFFLETFGAYVAVIRFFSGEAEAGDEAR